MGKPRANLREVDRAFIQTVMFQLGILPMEKTDLDMRRPLKQLSPEEARMLKRKFRKLWRKAMRAEIGNGRSANVREETAKARYGVGKHVPSRTQRNARKQLVFNVLWESVIEPMLKRFENGGGEPAAKGKT